MYTRILVPLDGSDTSKLALDTAICLARTFHGRLRLVHALEEPLSLTSQDIDENSADPQQALHRWGEELLQTSLEKVCAAGVEADVMLLDKPGQKMAEAVTVAAKLWGADLIVVGTHGRKGISRFMIGSGAEQLIRLAPVPVLAIRQPDAFSEEAT